MERKEEFWVLEREKEKEKEKENSPHKTRPQEKPAALRFGITDTNL